MKTFIITALMLFNVYASEAVTCADNEFKCDVDSYCIPNTWKCDGTSDCTDGADEQACAENACSSSNLFLCKNGNCIPDTWKCDDQNDCGDNSDETTETCPKKDNCEFQCKNGKCLATVWVCDKYDDCGDNSDEENCEQRTTTRQMETPTTTSTTTAATTAAATTRTTEAETTATTVTTTTKPETTRTTEAETTATTVTTTTKPETTRTTEAETTATTVTTTTTPETTRTTEAETTATTVTTTTKPETTRATEARTTPVASTTRQETGCSSSSQFQCPRNKMCIPGDWTCDGFNDCGDNADEANCESKTTISTAKATTPTTATAWSTKEVLPKKALSPTEKVCDDNEFLCGTGLCTFKAWRCDGDNDCSDGSDETNCQRTDPIVFPTQGQVVSSTSCSRNQFQCATTGACVHSTWVCDHERDCKDGSDEVHCVDTSVLIMTTKSSIQKISENLESTEEFIKRSSGTVAVDIDIQTQYVYWSDVKRKEIRCARLNDRATQIVVVSRVGVVEGIAVDWVARKLYWTDSLQSIIGVSGLRGQNRRALFSRRLDKPRGIVVHPSGYIFWTEWGANPKLSRSSMDGAPTSRKTIISRDIAWPNAVTIDYTTNTLWWADAKLRKIEHCNLDGSNRHVIADIGYPFSIAVSANYVYWTNWESNTVDRIRKDTSYGRIKKSRRFEEHPLGISLLDGRKHAAVHTECTTNNGGCSHLCLLSSEHGHYSCQCPDLMQIARDSKTCTTRVENACSNKHHRCDGGLCIDKSKRCDGVSDCLDNTDEQYCLTDKPRLVYGDRKKYVMISGLDKFSEAKVIGNAKSVIGLDVDIKNGYVFWADTVMNAIMKVSLDKNGDVLSSETVLDTYVYTPEGLAFDWVTNKLYWVDSYLRKIEVVDVEKKFTYPVVNTRLTRPRAVVVHPRRRELYWSDWGVQPYIAAISMDGDPSTRRKLVDSKIHWPNGLTIDYQRDILYWADGKLEKIETFRLNYNDRVREHFVPKFNGHPFSLTFYQGFVFWSDWQYEKIYKINTASKLDFIVRPRVAFPTGLAIFHKDRQERFIANPCAVLNGGCSHLCLLSSESNHGICKCPRNLQISEDGKKCINPYKTSQGGETNSLLGIGVV